MRSVWLSKGQKSSEITGTEAQARNERRARCPVCGNSVHLIGKGKHGWPEAHFEHDDRNAARRAGCSLTTKA